MDRLNKRPPFVAMARANIDMLLSRSISQNSRVDSNVSDEIRIGLINAADEAIKNTYTGINIGLVLEKLRADIRILRDKSNLGRCL